MHVLFIAGWSTPFGDFIKEHATAAGQYSKISYIYLEFVKTATVLPYSIETSKRTENNVDFYNIQVNCYLRRFGMYEWLIKKAFTGVIKQIKINQAIDLCHINVRTPVTELIPELNIIKDLPIILTEHSSFYHNGIYRIHKGEKLEAEKKRVTQWLANDRFKKVMPVSKQLGEVLTNDFGVPPNKIVTVPNVATHQFKFKQYAPNPDKINIVLIAIWSTPKNPLLFVKALSKLPKDILLKLNINWVGNGELLDEVKSYIQEHLTEVHFNFKGFVTEKNILASYIQEADFFVHPSDAENLPCVIIESLCCGTPIVANSINGILELVNESNGLLSPAKDVDAFAANLLEMIKNRANYNRQEISLRAQQLYYPEQVGKLIYNVYCQLAKPATQPLENHVYKMCKRCIMDSNDDPGLELDEHGVCTYCKKYEQLSKVHMFEKEAGVAKLNALVEELKKEGKNKPYDCILGVSGGVDSTYTAVLLKEKGINPLIVHLDNGWNSELAVKNIENLVQRLNFDLYTHVVEWEEFKDIQLSFLKASVVDIELVTDYAIVACLYNLAAKKNIKHIISGHNYATESIMPAAWTHAKSDLKNILGIHKLFGKRRIKTFPTMTYFQKANYVQLKKIKVVPILNYTDYNKEDAKKIMSEKLGWRDYGGKHSESIFTRFYQNYILPEKFHIDKRKAHLSSLICSGQLTRDEALLEMQKPAYNPTQLKEDKEYIIKKFDLSPEEFEAIMRLPIKKHIDYPSYVTSNYAMELKLSKRFKPLTKYIKKIFGIKIENNYV